ATRLLARPDASVLAILGAGVQARSHLEALRHVRPFREVRVWSPRNAKTFAERFGLTAAPSAEQAVRGADIVVVATTSETPVLLGEWLEPGTHVNAVGAPRPTWRELDDETLRRARIYVESREAAMRESGDIIAAGRAPLEIGEVVAGAAPGRQSPDEVTLCKSGGAMVLPGYERLVPPQKNVIGAGRQAGCPVLFVADTHRPNVRQDREFLKRTSHCLEGSWGAQVIGDLDPRPDDIYIVKRR